MPACKNDFSAKALAAPHGCRIRLGQRERRLKLNTNHVMSKHLLNTHPESFIGLEDLNGIRDRTKRRKYRRKKNKLVPVSPKARKANRHASTWAFAELQGFIRRARKTPCLSTGDTSAPAALLTTYSNM